MRVLFAVQHFYQPQERPFYGSQSADAAARVGAIAACILALYQTFDARQGLLDGRKRIVYPANTADPIEVSVAVCTTRDFHLIHQLSHLRHLFVHRPCDREPLFLGLECHAALREGLGGYDYFCFLEDDLALTDPTFFRKLDWFTGIAGPDALLQPNRYEVALGQPVHKLYIDGNLADATISPRFQNVADRPRIEAEALGTRYAFQRVDNPHAGCFFLDAGQMAHWASQPDFLVPDARFIGPLESSATLGIMRHFRLYKPARENAGFLEVRHLNNRYLGARIRFEGRAPWKLQP